MMNLRMGAAFCTVLFSGSTLVWAQDAAAPLGERTVGSEARSAEAARSARAPANPAVALLTRRVERVDWDETPFEEVILWLRDQGEGQVNVLPRWNQLGTERVDPDTPVKLKLFNTTVGTVLTEVLDELSEDGSIGMRVYGNVLRISTRTDLDRKLYTRIYDVTDLLVRVPDFGETAPLIDLQQQQGGSTGGSSGQGVFTGAGGGQGSQIGGEQAEQELLDRLTELSEVIQLTIAPESWATTAGPQTGGRGTIGVFNRALIVTNTIEVHEQIAGFFTLGE